MVDLYCLTWWIVGDIKGWLDLWLVRWLGSWVFGWLDIVHNLQLGRMDDRFDMVEGILYICGQVELEDYDISEVDHFFLISVGTLVLLLQSGYAFLEAGAVRSKNAVNISIRYRSIKKKDKDRREGKGRCCCLGGRID